MPASAQISMRSKPVTQSNGVVVRKASIRKLPINVESTSVLEILWMKKFVDAPAPSTQVASHAEALLSCHVILPNKRSWERNA